MTIAFFIYAEKKNLLPQSISWLCYLLEAIAAKGQENRVLVFSNVLTKEMVQQPRVLFIRYRVPRLLVRQRSLWVWKRLALQAGADALVCWGPQSFVSAGVPAFVIMPPNGNQQPTKMLLQKGVSKAAGIWTVSHTSKELLERLGVAAAAVVQGGPLLPRAATNAEAVKERYTGGCEFFLYAGPLRHTALFIGLLKAFSRFKHRQKSSWKLVLASTGSPEETTALRLALQTYKYRSDVVLPQTTLPQEETANLLAAAFAFVQPLPAGPFGSFLKEAVCAGLPVVAAADPLNKEVAGDAALYYEAGDEQNLAECLMRVYKDEALWGRLATGARQQAASFCWQQTAAKLLALLAGSVK